MVFLSCYYKLGQVFNTFDFLQVCVRVSPGKVTDVLDFFKGSIYKVQMPSVGKSASSTSRKSQVPTQCSANCPSTFAILWHLKE